MAATLPTGLILKINVIQNKIGPDQKDGLQISRMLLHLLGYLE